MRIDRPSNIHAVGVSLRLRGATIPNDSFVDLDDIMYTAPSTDQSVSEPPSNRNPRDEAVLCVTDLEDCCGTESGTMRAVHGDWYLPDGRSVALATTGVRFLVNRGPNEVIGQQQFYGSVRLFRRYSAPPERGRFRCELPNAAGDTQTLSVIICEFVTRLVHTTN
jgi:hypothetical protein